MVVIDTWENNYSLKSGEIVKMDKPGRDGVGGIGTHQQSPENSR
jgi:hypothetical protein